MKTSQGLSAEEFADEFINDLQEGKNIINQNFMFSWQVYKEDPNLTTLKSKLNKIGYDLKLIKKEEPLSNQEWQAIKI